jgi:mono/diheme cytochrome c family protein
LTQQEAEKVERLKASLPNFAVMRRLAMRFRGCEPLPCSARRWLTKGLSAAALSLMALLPGPVRADDDSVAKGRVIWKEKAGCQECHGWAGDGKGGFHHQGVALSLRVTQLTRDQIRMTIQCGRPGTPMPHFDRFAYTDKRCYGMTAEDLGDNVPNDSGIGLQPYEIDALADYVATKLKGAGPATRSQCLAYFPGSSGSQCDTYPDE